MFMKMNWCACWQFVVGCVLTGTALVQAGEFTFQPEANGLAIKHGDQPVATYFFRDERIARPFFANVHTPGGIQVTRNHPPKSGVDPADHDNMHPGLWLAFGDINGQDYWRGPARVEHVRFVEEPKAEGGQLTFAVENRYLAADGKTEVCRDTTRYRFRAFKSSSADLTGTVLLWDTKLDATTQDLLFTSQEEMGLGLRVASPLRVKGGNATIRNSMGGINEKKTWGQTATWWDYSGTSNERQAGLMLVTSPANTFPSWGHTRDYGLIVANPFPLPAKPPQRTTIRKGEALHLKYAILFHESSAASPADPGAVASEILRLLSD